ncbi:MAG: DUF296 domain-containing protein [Candidatus Diapherotrites archaeon]|nr:DUF296 domain-containing protein [Candidatus Diapherotrites archaeon]
MVCLAGVFSDFYKNKMMKKQLVLELEENDSVLDSIKLAMKNHGVKECTVDYMDGTIRSGKMTAMVGQNFKTLNLKDSKVIHASGGFKLSFDELFGSMHIMARVGRPETGTLANGTVAAGTVIKLGFYTEPEKK